MRVVLPSAKKRSATSTGPALVSTVGLNLRLQASTRANEQSFEAVLGRDFQLNHVFVTKLDSVVHVLTPSLFRPGQQKDYGQLLFHGLAHCYCMNGPNEPVRIRTTISISPPLFDLAWRVNNGSRGWKMTDPWWPGLDISRVICQARSWTARRCDHRHGEKGHGQPNGHKDKRGYHQNA
jgi:hypothetical protein